MKIAVDFQSGPSPMALTTLAIQLSPIIMDFPPCCEWGTLGSTRERLARCPALASVTMSVFTVMLFACGVQMQSAKLGQMAHP